MPPLPPPAMLASAPSLEEATSILQSAPAVSLSASTSSLRRQEQQQQQQQQPQPQPDLHFHHHHHHLVSRSSSPGPSPLDGSPPFRRRLSVSPPPRSRSTPPSLSLDMAIMSAHSVVHLASLITLPSSPAEEDDVVSVDIPASEIADRTPIQAPQEAHEATTDPEAITVEPLVDAIPSQPSLPEGAGLLSSLDTDFPPDQDTVWLASQGAGLAPQPDLLMPLPQAVPLDSVSHALRLQRYQQRRCSQLQAQLRQLQILIARTSRLATLSRSIHRTLAECIRSEDKASFATLFNELHNANDQLSGESSTLLDLSSPDCESREPTPSALESLAEPLEAAVTEMLTQVRTSGDFVASRLLSLSHNELLRLLPDRAFSRGSESVLESTNGSFHRASKHLGFAVDGQIESLTAESYPSPLMTLIHAVDRHGAQPVLESRRRLDVWSTVCARLLAEQKTGVEKVVPAVLDIWSSSSTWPGKERLEEWIRNQLRLGCFLLDQPGKQSFRMRIQPRPDGPSEEDRRTEAFYHQAVTTFLDLLTQPEGAAIIPEAVLQMCQAIWKKLSPSPNIQHGFSRFVLTRWLCPFLSETLSLPEAHGMLSDCYVSEHARSRILRETVNRIQKTLFDVAYAWRVGHIVSPDIVQRIEPILTRFEDRTLHSEYDASASASRNEWTSYDSDGFIMLSQPDIICIAKALYPDRRPASIGSDPAGIRSSASSISGFSLFRNSEFGFGSGDVDSMVGQADAGLEIDRQHAVQFSVPEEAVREACATMEELIDTRGDATTEWVVLKCTSEGLRPHRHSALSDQSDALLSSLPSALDDAIPQPLRMVVQELLVSDGSHFDAANETMSSYRWFSQRLQRKVSDAQDARDFLEAHVWYQHLRSFTRTFDAEDGERSLHSLLSTVYDGALARTDSHDRLAMACELSLRQASPALETTRQDMRSGLSTARTLRDKMWFVADVRTSASYDEARCIAGALRIMGKPKRPQKTRGAPPLRHWSASKLSATNLHLKSEAQILDLLSAAPEQGGPNKLSSDQSQGTASWMQRNNIENLCPGEERIHKLCMEIRKCVDTMASSENASLITNVLFSHDSLSTRGNNAPSLSLPSPDRVSPIHRFSQLSFHSDVPTSIDAISSASRALSSASSKEHLESRSPTLTHRSSVPFWSPAVTEARSPSSATSVGSYQTRIAPQGPRRKVLSRGRDAQHERLEALRQSLTSFLLSDLATPLYNEGSETDRAFLSGLGKRLAEKQLIIKAARMPNTLEAADDAIEALHFDFTSAFTKMLKAFALCCSPSAKLTWLHQIDQLLPAYLAQDDGDTRRTPSSLLQVGYSTRDAAADASIHGFRMLFSNDLFRPDAIFRDLQYIASLVPASVLETSAAGKAFCNAAIAATSLKQDIRNLMVETADGIIAYHSNNRGHGRSSSSAQQQRDSATFFTPSRSPSAEDIATYTMADAASLLQMTAKEGHAVAQRELATLYLTHPELMDHIIAPFARPRDVFKEELESKWRKNQDPHRCDPATMCVAHHWMGLSSRGGDALATEYLRQREEMERLP